MEFQLSYFKSWKMMLWKCCTQYASKFGKLSSGHRTGKGQFSFQFQRVARRDKKAFLSEQCWEREENNRMGKTRDLFKKIRDTNGKFHAKMNTIKDRNGVDLTEAEDIKPGFNSTWTENFQMFKLDLEKAKEPEIKSPTSAGSSKKQESSRKTSTFASLTMLKPLIV